MPHRKPIDTETLAKKLGHEFRDIVLLQEALTHPSLTGHRGAKVGHSGGPSYERLEFLGDRVLGLVMAEWLYELYPQAKEGELAKRHAALVNRDALKDVALKMELESHLRLAHGEDPRAPRKNIAALSDAMEGLIGALYLDGGLDVAERFIKRYWGDVVKSSAMPIDPKTVLQEYAQGKGLPLPVYKVLERSGPAHAPKFVIQVQVKGFTPVEAEGGSKREAEKMAAQRLLAEIEKA